MRMIVNNEILRFFLIVFLLSSQNAFAEISAHSPLIKEAIKEADLKKADCTLSGPKHHTLTHYPDCKNPERLYRRALKSAKADNVPLMVVWGFDECPNCQRLETTLKGNANQPAMSGRLFSYALSQKQRSDLPNDGKDVHISLLRLNINTYPAAQLARKIGLYTYAATMDREKLWSPLLTFHNPDTEDWVSYSAINGFKKPCDLRDEIALALTNLGYIPADPAKVISMCKMY